MSAAGRELALVTGAAGHLGSAVLRELAARGFRTRALRHRRDVPEADEQSHGSLGSRASLDAACDGVGVVVHMAAVTHARRRAQYRRANVGGTRELIAAARLAGVRRFVLVSSRTAVPQAGAYGESKLEAERELARSGLEHVTVRLAEVYGVEGGEGIVELLEQARTGRPIPIVGSGCHEVCPVHVADAAGGIAAAAAEPRAAGHVYLLAGECLTVRELAEACVARFGSGSRIVRVPEVAVRLAAWLSRFAPLPLYPDQLDRLKAPKPSDVLLATRDLGFVPRPLSEGLGQLGGG